MDDSWRSLLIPVGFAVGPWAAWIGFVREPGHSATWTSNVVTLVLLVVLMTSTIHWLRRISRPPSQIALVFACVAALVILVFTSLYFGYGMPPDFGQRLTRIDAVYFTVTTFATVGYGDISPQSQLARGLVTAQIVLDFIFLLAVGVVATRALTERRHE